MTATLASHPVRLPLWRALTGFGVLATLVAVLLALAPVYLQNYRLTGKVKTVVNGAVSLTDDALRTKLLAEAGALRLPVLPGDVKITRSGDALDVQLKYIVHRNLGLYQVDLHFHPAARLSRPPTAPGGHK